MRITRNMMINNMMHWTSRQAERLYDAETVSGSGKRINKPSDDPLSAGQILEDRATISKFSQYQSNIAKAETAVETGMNVLDAVYSAINDAKGIAMDQAGGDLDNRETAVIELEAIYDQIIDLANTMYGSGYLYSGSQTGTRPLSDIVEISSGTAEDVLFDLAEDASSVTVEIRNSAGDVVRTLTPGTGTAGTNTIVWDGLDDSGNPLPDGEYFLSVEATGVAGDAVAAWPTYRGGDGEMLFIIGDDSTVGLNTNGGEIFSNALASISVTITALEADPYDPDVVSAQVDELNAALESMEAEMVKLSIEYARLETADGRIERDALTVQSGLTATEAGSTEQAIVELQAQQTAYETTLNIMSEILNMPRLLDML